MSNQRQYPRTPLRARILIRHESFGELLGQTRDLSDAGVYVHHPQLAGLAPGAIVSGQLQDLPIPAPVLRLRVTRVDEEGAGLSFVDDPLNPA